jgi:hypothetical protein
VRFSFRESPAVESVAAPSSGGKFLFSLNHYTSVKERLDQLTKDYFELLTAEDAQKRGFQLKKLLKSLFELFDLNPKAFFRITGEQIDGAFTFESTDYTT